MAIFACEDGAVWCAIGPIVIVLTLIGIFCMVWMFYRQDVKKQRQEYEEKIEALCSAPLVMCEQAELPDSTTWKAKLQESGVSTNSTYHLMFTIDGAMRGFKTDEDGTHAVLGKYDKNQGKALWVEIVRENIQGEAGDDFESVLRANKEQLLSSSRESPAVTVCEATFDVRGNDLISTLDGQYWSSHGFRGLLHLRSPVNHFAKADVVLNLVDVPFAAPLPLDSSLARRYSAENESPLRAVTLHQDAQRSSIEISSPGNPARPTADPNLFSNLEIQRMQRLQAQHQISGNASGNQRLEVHRAIQRPAEVVLEIEEIAVPQGHEPTAPSAPSSPMAQRQC